MVAQIWASVISSFIDQLVALINFDLVFLQYFTALCLIYVKLSSLLFYSISLLGNSRACY